MNAPCYCYDHKKQDKVVEEKESFDMKLDTALHELGMLSMVTNSRDRSHIALDYLKEKSKKKRSSNSVSSAPLCVVQMNSKFVTKFSLTKDSSASAESESEEENHSFVPTSFVPCDPAVKSARKECYYMTDIKRRRKLREFKPYFCWRSKLEDSLKNIPAAAASERASPPAVSRQDSGNKSNPSSPVKSQNSMTNLGCSIFRSRSLDDLEISKLDEKEDCCYEASRGDIDAVSQRISNLHVS